MIVYIVVSREDEGDDSDIFGLTMIDGVFKDVMDAQEFILDKRESSLKTVWPSGLEIVAYHSESEEKRYSIEVHEVE